MYMEMTMENVTTVTGNDTFILHKKHVPSGLKSRTFGLKNIFVGGML